MKGLRTLLDTFTGVMYLVGPGGYELRLSPGSEKYDLHESSMGHLMLPCSEFDPRGGQQSTEVRSFVVGEHFASVAEGDDDWEEPENFWTGKKEITTPTAPNLPMTRRPGARASVDQTRRAITPTRVEKHSASSGTVAPSS